MVVWQLHTVIKSVKKNFSVVIIFMKFGSIALSELARIVQREFVVNYSSSLAGTATNLSRRQTIL